MPILTDTPKQLFDLYSLLTPENKGLFLRMIGGISPAEHTFLFMSGQTVLEQYRFNEMIFRETTHKFFPVIIQHAAKLVKEMPSASVEELAEALFEQAGQATDQYNRDISEVERARLKEQRDRKVDDERLERGRIILEANRNGISWKNMPAHILNAHPDWLPEFQGKSPSKEERKQLSERLRKWARDAKNT